MTAERWKTGTAYKTMLENDLHDPASVDYQLLKNMVLPEDASAPFLYREPVRYEMAGHELYAYVQQFKGRSERESITNVLRYTSGIAADYDTELSTLYMGIRFMMKGPSAHMRCRRRNTEWMRIPCPAEVFIRLSGTANMIRPIKQTIMRSQSRISIT